MARRRRNEIEIIYIISMYVFYGTLFNIHIHTQHTTLIMIYYMAVLLHTHSHPYQHNDALDVCA